MSIFLPAQDLATTRRRRVWAGCIAGAILIVVVGWRPVRDGFRRLHARKLVAEAEAYAAQNRPAEAIEAANKALQKEKTNPRTVRMLLDLYARGGRPEAFSFWALLARHSSITFDDRRELLRWAVTWGQTEAAAGQWQELESEKPMRPETIRLGVAYWELRGDARRAVIFAQETIAANPNDLETRVLLGRVLLKSGGATDQAIGKRLLLEQAERTDQLGLAVLRHLAASDALLPFEASQCLGWLERNHEREKTDDLTMANFQIRLTPYRKEQIVAEAARRFIETGGDLKAAGHWLFGQSAHAEFVRLIPFEQAGKVRELARLHLDSLVVLKQWSEIERLVGNDTTTIEPFERALYRARAAAESKQPRVAELQWKQAQELAGKEPRSLLVLAGYARGAGSWEVAEHALRTLATHKNFEAHALQYLVRLFDERGEIGKLRDVLTEMKAKFPDDPAIQNDLTYLDLLRGREIQRSLEAAEKLVEANPKYLAFRATLALAHLRQGSNREALSILEAEPVNWSEALPAQRAVYAAALGNGGDETRARLMCREIAAEVLKPEERALIAKWL